MPSTEGLANLAEAVGPAYSAMVWLGAVAGLRWAETAGLRVKHVDFLRSTITVTEQWARGRVGKESTSEPKSSAGRRTMTMPEPLEGVDVKTAQLRLGHADPNTTLAIYAQGTTESDRSAADKLGKRFFSKTDDDERGMDAG